MTKEILKNSKGFFETLGNLTDTNELSLEKSEKILDSINNQQGHIFVALKDDYEIIGTTTILIENKFIHGGSRVAHIEDVATRKGYEGKGIGKSIINKCSEFAKEQNCYKMILDCMDKNISFYEKLGFIENGVEMRMNVSQE